MADAVSIEQMNKVRASLGLAPLPTGTQSGSGPQFKSKDEDSDSDESDDLSTVEKRQAAAGSNWQKLEAEKQAKLDREKRKSAAKKARDSAARFEQLKGKTLGEADEGEELDTRTWLLQQKKRQKKIERARKLEEELAAQERQVEYTAKDLAGVKVGHEASEFDKMTGEQILTLKDANIGDESEEDELENAELRAKEKLEEKLRLKKKRPDYDPTEEGGKQKILSKYDEEIDGKKQKRFTLDGQGGTTESTEDLMDVDRAVKKGVQINLDMLKDSAPVSDYLNPSTATAKKPKKSKKDKKSRQKKLEENEAIPPPSPLAEIADDLMDVEVPAQDATEASKKRPSNFDDDDNALQATLAEQRRQALKKRKTTDATDIVRHMQDEMPVDDVESEQGNGLTVDETSEFVSNMQRESSSEDDPRRANWTPPHLMYQTGDQEEDSKENVDVKEEPDAGDEEEVGSPNAGNNMTATGLEDEEVMTGGMAATVAMLRRRGVVDEYIENDNRTEAERRRARFLSDKQSLIDEYDRKAREQRERDRNSGRYDHLSHRERDALGQKANEMREQYIAKLLAEKFTKDYRPDVKLKYNDEYGREMNSKEAFKHLSHMFHGKGSGKQKTEKRLKKIEDEKKEMAKGILSVRDEGGMLNVQGREGKKQKKAGVRLQ